MSDAVRRQNLLEKSKVNSVHDSPVTSEVRSTWKIRFLFSVVFFLLFYALEKYNLEIGGITSEKIYETLCDSTKGFDFTLDFPYTLND